MISADYFAVRDNVTGAVETYPCGGGRCAPDGECDDHRLAAAGNPLCGQCVSGYTEWDGDCVACPGVNGGLVFGLLLLALLCVLATHALSQSSSGTSSLRIALYFWQAALLIVDRSAWLGWAGFLNLNFLAVGRHSSPSAATCPFPASPPAALLMSLLGPTFVFALLAVVGAVHRLMALSLLDPNRCCSGDADGMRSACWSAALGLRRFLRHFEAAAYWRTAVALYFLTFNSITRQCLDFFSCATVQGGTYLAARPAIRCDSAGYSSLTPVFVAVLVLYVAMVPSWMAWQLQSLNGGNDARARVWGVIVGPFRKDARLWVLSQLGLRAAAVSVAVFLPRPADDSTRFGLLTLLHGSALLLLVRLRPNRSAADNAWEGTTLGALTVLSTSESMHASDAWLATLTLCVGVAVVARLGAERLRRIASWCGNRVRTRGRVNSKGAGEIAMLADASVGGSERGEDVSVGVSGVDEAGGGGGGTGFEYVAMGAQEGPGARARTTE